MSKRTICHIGPGQDMPGGMLSVIQGYMNSEYLEEYNHIHLVSVSVKHKIKTFILSCIKLNTMLKIKRIDIVHIHMSERGSCIRTMAFINLCKKYNVPVIVHSHGSEIEIWIKSVNKIIKNRFKKSMQKADAILVLTPGWVDFWREIVDVSNIYVVPNYVKVTKFIKKIYLKNECLHVLFMGQIGERKGTFDLIRAIKIIKNKGYNVKLHICGDGEREKCDDLIKKYNLLNEVKTLGWVNGKEKKQELYNADCLVLPSKYESFGIVLLEGMANQLPCICGDGGYSKEILKDGVDGFVIESGNEESIAAALQKFYEKDILDNMGTCAYYNVKKKFSEEVVIKKLITVYKIIKQS